MDPQMSHMADPLVPATMPAPTHYLTLPRPSPNTSTEGPDTTTLAAHDFDVDVRTGFMPPSPPCDRLPSQYDVWESVLEDALSRKFKLGEHYNGVTAEELRESADWRERVRTMPILPTTPLYNSEILLRRAHLVLSFILHIFIHTHPSSTDPYLIPPSISVPILALSREIDLPPVLTYSDTVLYNWRYDSDVPNELRSVSLFSSTADEQHFYLTSAKIELRGVEALSLMRGTLDEVFLADAIALKRIATYLRRLAVVIGELTTILDNVRTACDPAIFYRDIRPWFNGEQVGGRRWVFLDEEGKEVVWQGPRELGGPSAGQSSLVHALDVFLGVDHSQSRPPGATAPTSGADATFMQRMQSYMPRHHRHFLTHLGTSARPLRNLMTTPLVTKSKSKIKSMASAKEAYNEAILALKKFRDAHIRIATLYIVSQAHRRAIGEESPPVQVKERGTGGTDLVPFLKSSRDDTARTVV